MKNARCAKRFTLALSALLAANPVLAEMNHAGALLPPPPAAPLTLWNFLGIPQGLNKIRDVTTNRTGNHPGLERQPPPRAIADYRNLESPNPAIKKAAEIKAEEDLAPQKIKALKYLATVGCGCYPGVKEALMAAADDCTEVVRYQAMLSIIDAAKSQCDVCGGKNCCCDQELTLKLAQIAYEKDDKCGWLESSERVRDAAKEALRACCPNTGPYTPPVENLPPVDEGPEPIRKDEDVPEVPMAMLPGGRVPAGALQARSETDTTVDMITLTFEAPQNMPRSNATSQRHPAVRRNGPAVPAPAQAVATDSPRVAKPVAKPRKENKIPSSHSELTIVSESDSDAEVSDEQPVIIKRTDVPADAVKPSSRRQAAKRGIALPDVAIQEPEQAPAQQPAHEPLAQRNEQAAYLAPEAPRLPEGREKAATSKPAEARGPAERAAAVDRRGEIRRLPRTEEPMAVAGSIGIGSVARVNVESGTVELKFSRGTQLAPGMKLEVSHGYLLKEDSIGQLEVVAVGATMVTARPIDDCPLAKISRGDAVTEVGAKRPAPTQQQASGRPAGKPAAPAAVWITDLAPTRR